MSTAMRPVLIVRPAVLKCSLLYSCNAVLVAVTPREILREEVFACVAMSDMQHATHLS